MAALVAQLQAMDLQEHEQEDVLSHDLINTSPQLAGHSVCTLTTLTGIAHIHYPSRAEGTSVPIQNFSETQTSTQATSSSYKVL